MRLQWGFLDELFPAPWVHPPLNRTATGRTQCELFPVASMILAARHYFGGSCLELAMEGCDHRGEAPSAVHPDKKPESQDQPATDSAASIDSRSKRKHQECQPVLAV